MSISCYVQNFTQIYPTVQMQDQIIFTLSNLGLMCFQNHSKPSTAFQGWQGITVVRLLFVSQSESCNFFHNDIDVSCIGPQSEQMSLCDVFVEPFTNQTPLLTILIRVQRFPEKELVHLDKCPLKGTRPALISTRPSSDQFKLRVSKTDICYLRFWWIIRVNASFSVWYKIRF